MTSWERRVPSSDKHEIPLGQGCDSQVSICFSHSRVAPWENAETDASMLLGLWTFHTEGRSSWKSSPADNKLCACIFFGSLRYHLSPHPRCLSSASCTLRTQHCQCLLCQNWDWSPNWLSDYDTLSEFEAYILSNAALCVPFSFFLEFLTPAEAKT